MKVTLDWLKQYCPFTEGTEELCEKLTMGVTPLESSSPLPDGDHLLELEITSNRGDLLGVLGVAREVHAITGAPFEPPDLAYPTVEREVQGVAKVTVEDPHLCPRYTARAVEGVKVGPSPDWLILRLGSVGLRSVNNVVDVTNFVCLEYGQPLHAFDLDRVAGSHIIIRRARAGERMTTLDGREQELEPDQLLIADEKAAVAVAGVMGGLDSEVTPATTRILLESAAFDPASVRRTARALSSSTESSSRFERGVAWGGVDDASRRAIALILEVAGGEALEGVIDIAAKGAGEPARISMRFAQLHRLSGVEVPEEEAVEILERLGCTTLGRDKESVTVSSPGHRTDIGREADLVEEVLRVFGYDKVPENPRLPLFPVEGNRMEDCRREVQDLLRGFGYREALTLSFSDPSPQGNPSAWTESPPLRILTPVRPELAGLRRGLLMNLLEVKKLNLDRGNEQIRIFEVGRIYLPKDGEDLPEEKETLGLLADGDPLDLKGVIEAVLAATGCEERPRWEPREFPLFRKEASWACTLGETCIGVLGAFGPGSPHGEDWRGRTVAGAEVDLQEILSSIAKDRPFRPLPRFPGADRDLSVILDETVPWGEVQKAVRDLQEPLLQDVTLFDLYRGKPIPSGKKNFAFTLHFRSDERTLTGEEVEVVRQRVVERLKASLGGEIRS